MSDLTSKLEITRRRLPHWRLQGATYFVTFRLLSGELTADEISEVGAHIFSGDPDHYDLVAVVVMPDHVHLLLRPRAGLALSRIMKGVKGVSARALNQRRGTKGSIWQDESFDRIVRDQAELDEKLNCMFMNPVKAGLTQEPESYIGWYFKGQTRMSAPPRAGGKSAS